MYVAILFVIFLFILVLAFFEDEKIRNNAFLLISIGFVLLLYVAFRPEGIDKDYMAYLGYYKNPTGVAAELTEPTFKAINGFARMCKEPLLLFVTYAILAVPLKIHAITRLSPYWYLSILVWVTHLFIIQEMTQIRVAVASGIFLFSIPSLAEGKKVTYLLYAVLASLFHYSALVLLPLAFLGNKRLSSLTMWILVIFPIVMYMFPMVSMDIIKYIPIPFIQQKLQMYEDLMEYEGGVWVEINIFNVMALVRLFSYYMLIWKYKFLSEKYPYMPILLKVFCYSICLYVGLSFLPPIAMRIEELVSIIDCILLPLLAVLIKPHWLGRLLVIIYTMGIIMANIFLYKLLRL